MFILVLPIFVLILFLLISFLVAKRNKIVSLLIAVCCTAVIFIPFRAYKIALLDPGLKKAIQEDVILKTKKIFIPQYPGAYNPSIIPYEDGYLLSFRVKSYNFLTLLKKISNVRTSYLGFVKLNKNFEISGEPYLLDLQSNTSPGFTGFAQDARLFRFQDQILLIYNDYGSCRARSCYSLFVTEMVEKEGRLVQKSPSRLLAYDKMISIEKNWAPFEFEGNLYLIYSGEPHLILKVDLETGVCKQEACTDVNFQWKWGIIRGGTPALPAEGQLFALFHSSFETPAYSFFGKTRGRNYAMGAYLLRNGYPFTPIKVTPYPIASLDDYTEDNRRKVLFPGGMVIEGNKIHVVWGKNDSSILISTLDREKLFSSMVSI